MKSFALPLLPFLIACQAAFAAPQGGTVILTEQGVKNLALEIETAEEADFENTTFALGRTEAVPERRSVVSSRISGRVVETRLRVGMRVAKGDKLLLVESRQPGDPPPSVWLTAPADGTVLTVNAFLGAPVEPAERLAEIADLGTIYLIARLPQATAGKIGQGARARVRFPIQPDKEYPATLVNLAACPCPDPACALGQDAATRPASGRDADLNTTGVIFAIENPDNRLRPGMNAECSIIMERREGVLSVPREAIQGGPANRHVYVKHATIPNAFDRVSVHTGLSSNERVEIIEGLFPGDEVVTRGSYSLGFAGAGGGPSLKEALDAAHGHSHNEDGTCSTTPVKPAPQGDGHDHAAAAGAGHPGSGGESAAVKPREMFFIAATGILALLLLVVSLRRHQPADHKAELS